MKFARMKQHHRVRVDKELCMNCAIWLEFLEQPNSICRPFVDFSDENKSEEMTLEYIPKICVLEF